MKKFKFVNVRSGGPVKVVAQSEVSILNKSYTQFLTIHKQGVHFGISMADSDTAGDSGIAETYKFNAKHLYLSDDPVKIIASLRSLADELEKALGESK